MGELRLQFFISLRARVEMLGCRKITKYQPVGFPVLPSFPCEVRTKRILGFDEVVIFCLVDLVD